MERRRSYCINCNARVDVAWFSDMDTIAESYVAFLKMKHRNRRRTFTVSETLGPCWTDISPMSCFSNTLKKRLNKFACPQISKDLPLSVNDNLTAVTTSTSASPQITENLP
ncbi:unnamed protein product [Larinioides sclopetarius]|uniref:Uncharacterized protein n=1 Tax=Larinioides sclopetarius TaxID=280406 RepID=A0AAV1YZ98_9ARAC